MNVGRSGELARIDRLVAGPRILDGVGPIRLLLVAATPYRSGVLWLRYRPAGA